MVSSGRQAIACILLVFSAVIYSQAQTTPAKQSTASIGGKVTLKDKGVPGIVVIANDYNYRGPGDRGSYRATTDASGNYRISNIPEGSYLVTPHVAAFALENDNIDRPVNVPEGDTIEDLNFVLVRGGVITGKVTDSDGQPLIEQPVHLTPLDNQNSIHRIFSHISTDDRGVFRAFGLRQGKYKVAAGTQERRLPAPGRPWQFSGQTFYPSTTDEEKATVIELAEGSEVKDIDIVIASRAPEGFRVTGMIIDGETGKPLPNITYGVTQHYEGGTSSTSGARSNADGEFKFDNLLPGKYSVFVQPEQNSQIRANPVRFEVIDSDLTGLVVKAVKGATLSGVVVIEGVDEKLIAKKLSELHVSAHVTTGTNADAHENAVSMLVKPDGTFKLNGLRAGTAQVLVSSFRGYNSEDMRLVRVERDGIVQFSGITIKEGEQVQGLRLVVKHLTGAIRGQVKIEGELPRSTQVFVLIALIDETPHRSYRSEQVDSRGRFYIQGLAAGRYEVTINAFGPGALINTRETKQEVTVADNTVSEVTLTLKLKNDQ